MPTRGRAGSCIRVSHVGGRDPALTCCLQGWALVGSWTQQSQDSDPMWDTPVPVDSPLLAEHLPRAAWWALGCLGDTGAASCLYKQPLPLHSVAMRAASLFLLLLPGLLAQGQYDLDPLPPFPDHGQYPHYGDQIETPDYYEYHEMSTRPSEEEQFQFQSQQQVQQEVIPVPTPEPGNGETEPTEPGPLDCREEQYPCTRLYSIHKPCKQCLNEVCFYSLRRVYVVNKEICVRTVCAHEELLRADLCRDKFSKCGVMASSGLCHSVAVSCARSCGGC